MRNSSKRTIRCKVTDRVVVALLITIISISVVNLIYMSRRVVQEQQQELKLATELCASEIDSWTLNMETIACGIADSIAALNTLDETEIKKLLNQSAWVHGDLFFVYVATEEGDMYMARGIEYPEDVDVRGRAWYKQVKGAGHTIVTNPYISASRPDIVLATAAVPVYFGTQMVAVVGVDADIATINEYVNSIDFKNGAYGFLVDTDGNIVAHKNEDFLPTSDASFNVADVMPDVNHIIEYPSSEMIMASDYTNTKMVYYTTRLKESRWIVGVAYPQKNMYKIIDRGIRISVGIAVICILIAIADITAAIKRILLPIEKINPAMDRLRQGDFSTGLDISTEEDELGTLQRNMSEMMKELSEMINKQKYVLGEMEKGNLVVENIEEFPGELNEIANSVNSIKETFNDIISDIQFSAINLQSFAMGINETSDLEEMRLVFEELSAEANILMEKTSKFITLPPGANTDNT